MLKRLKNIGPGAMVAAAFIGPGTITTATLAGSGFGFTLLWAILFSVLATFLLQEMSARLGVIGRLGLGEAIREKIDLPILKWLASILVIGAIWMGNAAYEAGNITGAVLGFDSYFLSLKINPLVFIIVVTAFLILYAGKYNLIERFLLAMVSLMGLVFLLSALLLKPNLGSLIKGTFIPTLPDGSLLMVVGLIGTTVVPYNLFLHAASAKAKWPSGTDLSISRWDTAISVVIGGLITMSVVITAAVALHGSGETVTNAADLSTQLRPLLGSWSEVFISVGFLAAGLSSAITAPLAAAFATSGIMGWQQDMKGPKFRAVWIFVLLVGAVFSSLGFKPIAVILFAQVANGLLLPIVALFLLWIMNDTKIMGSYANTTVVNFLGLLVVVITVALGIKSILAAFNFI